MKSSGSKHFCCTICQRGFTRIDHLKRHHLRLTIYGTTTRTAPNEETERFPKLDKEAEGVMRANRSCQKRNLHCDNERNQVKEPELGGISATYTPLGFLDCLLMAV
ncbi:unnamed protein product [Aspergillus oryzae RIB40]|uniref:DNA, SC026 n=2 Tax=Aspergillus oryzae TaxID=5062 RepID=Q2UE30_ASPOR|nr:unnamed protein product [Aspergillus oryzae RIB40]EIT82032.1 hypothetical protein Ao3042_00694 [Aspergillus oryzae 3.042]KDE79724.1 hypothetical protein AO1008_05773 [Aspergillus oryzae 100-8]BAE60185.1 unnamed protein product [Aspergillus oryzae RIB40]|eukprot:EIT82032.1 hypothetical protein Ao3042_00694 [Aspergillus oryzae 3.042]